MAKVCHDVVCGGPVDTGQFLSLLSPEATGTSSIQSVNMSRIRTQDLEPGGEAVLGLSTAAVFGPLVEQQFHRNEKQL